MVDIEYAFQIVEQISDYAGFAFQGCCVQKACTGIEIALSGERRQDFNIFINTFSMSVLGVGVSAELYTSFHHCHYVLVFCFMLFAAAWKRDSIGKLDER